MTFEEALVKIRAGTGRRVRLPVWPAEQYLYWDSAEGPVINDPLNGVRRLEFVPVQMWISELWDEMS